MESVKLIELEDRKTFEFEAEEGQPTRFVISVNQPTMINIDTWPLNESSDPDLYVSTQYEDVDKEKYDWKSENIGADSVVIYPDDHRFKIGKFFIAVVPFRSGLN